MLREIQGVKQVQGEPRRRWFYSERCELMLWLDDGDRVVRFQFSYDKDANQHALTWEYPDTFRHTGIDSGETHPLKPKATPIHVADGVVDGPRLCRLFRDESAAIPKHYFEAVAQRMAECVCALMTPGPAR